MKRLFVLSLILIFYFSYGLYISRYDPALVTEKIKNENPPEYYDYKGVINVHTHLSVGSMSSQEILPAAKKANLDFIIFSDLNNFNFKDSDDSYYNGVLALYGAKYSYLDSRIIYYSDSRPQIGNTLGETQVSLADFLSQNKNTDMKRLLILAHPYKTGFNWHGELPEGLDGFELLNTKSMANRSFESSFFNIFWSFVLYPFNPKLSFARLFAEPSDELILLDQVSGSRKINIYAGTEASSRAIPLGDWSIRFPSYQRMFEFMSNHVLLRSELTGNIHTDKSKILLALKNGHHYLAMDIFGDTKGFIATINDKDNHYLFGEEIKFSSHLKMKVQLPDVPKDFFEVIIFKNSEKWRIYNSDRIEIGIPGPGVYRVQVRVSPFWPIPDARKWVTWIYTNNFYVR